MILTGIPVLCLCLVGVGVVDGLLYAVGGHDGPMVRKSVEVYNPDSDRWSQVADMTLCRRNAGMGSFLLSFSNYWYLSIKDRACYRHRYQLLYSIFSCGIFT